MAEVRQRFQEHFGEQECAELLATMDLVKQHLERSRDDAFAGPFLADALVSLRKLEWAFKDGKPGTAMGLDGIPGELFASLPQAMASIFHPLLVQIGARVGEPLSFRGGRLQELWKGKGSLDQVKSFRSILISNGLGKHWHRLLRYQLAPYLDQYAPEVVCAARHRGTDVGVHLPRAVAE